MKILVVVDMQRDFIDGALGTKEAAAIVPAVVSRVENSAGELILFTLDTHGADYLQTTEGKHLPVPHCIEGTAGHCVDEKILTAWRENKNTIIAATLSQNAIKKPIFGSVELVDFLKRLEREGEVISEVELLGLCTDICVVANAILLKTFFPDAVISVRESYCAGVTPKSHTEAINTMKMCQINII